MDIAVLPVPDHYRTTIYRTETIRGENEDSAINEETMNTRECTTCGEDLRNCGCDQGDLASLEYQQMLEEACRYFATVEQN
jgi:hypothetical protein